MLPKATVIFSAQRTAVLVRKKQRFFAQLFLKRCRANIFKISVYPIIMFDVVIPNGNEEDFIDMALSSGYSQICFLVEDSRYSYASKRIGVKKALLVKSVNQISKSRKNFDFIFANAERKFFESKIDYIINAELFDRKDSFHFKRTALNQVHAKLAKSNNIAVLFSFSNLLSNRRIQTLGRMFQNAILVKKYKLQSNAFSLTKDPTSMKSRNILDALIRVLGV